MNSRSERIVVAESRPGDRLDSYLRAQFPAVSRGTLQRLIDEGHITVNGARVKPSHRPCAGERIDVHFPEPRPAAAMAEAIPLEILFEDEDLVVVNKAPGLVVHPAAGHDEHTLVNALLHHCAGHLSGIGGEARPGIVHRLDKETSGCLVAAKNDATHQALSEQFASRSVRKLYAAVVCGRLLRDAGEIRASIARHPNHRKRMAVTDGKGRDAWTSYTVVERLCEATWVEAQLHTGRTHQIRVHFQSLGHPLAGDIVYGKRQTVRLTERTHCEVPRVMLHAAVLEFDHPRTGARKRLQAPLPPDFEALTAALRSVGNGRLLES
ncbi:MAG: RluA family pseudouridine synthase, partial [Phycisphaeraceae bacterium]